MFLTLLFLKQIIYSRIPSPFSRVRDFGLGNMGFSVGVSSVGLRLGVFYVVVYGSAGGSILWVLGLGFLVS